VVRAVLERASLTKTLESRESHLVDDGQSGVRRTLLMVFILQNSRTGDGPALHVKLDEVITHLEGPRDDVAGIESKSHEELEELHEELHEEVGAAENRPRQDA
jgi:low affinity Fe/Cu permease